MQLDRKTQSEIDEIEFWLNLSSSYFQIFLIKRNPGPSWFLMCEILKVADGDFTIGSAINALQLARIVRNKADSEAAMYLKYLHSLKYVEIETNDFSNRVFQVKVVVRPTTNLESAVKRYIKHLLGQLFNPETADAASDNARVIMNSIYVFMKASYIPVWERFLDDISQISARLTGGDSNNVLKRLVGSTEAFAILNRLWVDHLKGDAGESFTMYQLKNMDARARGASEAAIKNCVYLLTRQKILRKDTDGDLTRYGLRDDYFAAFEKYAAEFVTMREALRMHFKKAALFET